MAKQRQKRKSSKKRLNPLERKRIEAGMKEATSKITALSPDQVAPVVSKLTCDDATERAWAAACVSNLVISDASTRKVLLSKGIVPLLIERLGDNQQEVRDEALGALRNLASVDHTVANEYYNRNIMQPLSTLLPQISQTIDDMIKGTPIQDDQDADRRRSIWDVAENFIYVVWSICEASDKYITAVNRMNIVTFLSSFLTSSAHCPTRVVIAAGQCLNTLTDDNKDIYIEFQNHPEYTTTLLNLINDSNNTLVQVLACAILLNVREVVNISSTWDEDNDTLGELNKVIVPVLTKALHYDTQEAANKVIEAVQSGKVRKDNDTIDVITPKPKQPLTSEEVYVQHVEDQLSIVQLALELLADICVQDDSEEDGYQDMDEVMEGQEEEDEQDEQDDEQAQEDPVTIEEVRSNPVLRAYMTEVFPQLIRLSGATPISYEQASLVPHITHGFILTHQRALECLNNFLLAMNEIPSKYWFKEHKSDAVQLWRWLFNMANEISTYKPNDWLNLVEIIIGCLWALGRGLGQDIPLDRTDVDALCGTFESMPPDSSMRVRIVGCLGPIAMRQGDIEMNKTIGLFIMKLIQSKRKEPSVVVEALNFMFDVYSDCAFDYDLPVFIECGFLNGLKQVLPSVRSMVKSIDKRKNFDLRLRGDEALDNLIAFIKYKKSERS